MLLSEMSFVPGGGRSHAVEPNLAIEKPHTSAQKAMIQKGF